jgi:ATP adenylyltransferase
VDRDRHGDQCEPEADLEKRQRRVVCDCAFDQDESPAPDGRHHQQEKDEGSMQRLWAPWRMQYIGGEQRPGCLFCRAFEDPGDSDAELVVWRAERALVMLNRFPYNPGHAMVVPRAHVPTLEDLDDADTGALMGALRMTLKAVREVMNPQGFNVGANIGTVAGAGIPDHVHLHTVPRWNGDTNFMPVLDDVKVVNESLAQTAAKLRPAFAGR